MPTYSERLYMLCERYKISDDARRALSAWANERELVVESRERFRLDAGRLDAALSSAVEHMRAAIKENFNPLLDAICERYKVAADARTAFVKWADERALLHGWEERSKVLGKAVGCYLNKSVLHAALKAVEPEKRWNGVSALHMEYYGHQIITGADEGKKAKFIAACRGH